MKYYAHGSIKTAMTEIDAHLRTRLRITLWKHKTCVVRAISKEVLARAGLVSYLDYYDERHALQLC